MMFIESKRTILFSFNYKRINNVVFLKSSADNAMAQIFIATSFESFIDNQIIRFHIKFMFRLKPFSTKPKLKQAKFLLFYTTDVDDNDRQWFSVFSSKNILNGIHSIHSDHYRIQFYLKLLFGVWIALELC